MVGASKILTVSYGTFSCTLEGFDDSFSTMKAIAEYFRDLAADDRYFGAEPPTPDANMLAQIAEREIHKRVEAKIGENGVVLRASSEATALAGNVALEDRKVADDATDRATQKAEKEPARLETEESEDQVVSTASVTSEADFEDEAAEIAANLDDQRSDGSATIDLADFIDADKISGIDDGAFEVEAQDLERVYTPVPLAADDDSVAAKLQRIRAVVARAAPTASPLDAFSEDEHAVAFLDTDDQEDALEIIDISSDAENEDLIEDTSEVEALQVAVPEDDLGFEEDEELAIEEELSSDEAPSEMENLTATPDDIPEAISQDTFQEEVEAEAETAEVEDDSEEAEIDFGGILDTDISDDMESDVIAEEEVAEVEAEDVAPYQLTKEDQVDDAAATEQDEAIDDDILGAIAEDLSKDAEEEVAVEQDDIAAKLEALDEVAAEETVADIGNDVETIDETAEEVTEGVAEDVAIEVTEEAVEAELGIFARARARVIKMKKSDFQEAVASGSLEEVSEDTQDEGTLSEDSAEEVSEGHYADSTLSPEAEAELMQELAEVEQDADEADQSEQAVKPSMPVSDADEDVNRLLMETNTKLEAPESKNRRSAIAHLKAAVAATVADRKLKMDVPESKSDDTDRYRDDLAKVVRPSRHHVAKQTSSTDRPASDRPAPLVLVSEQRIDKPAQDHPSGVVRPRRVSALALRELEDNLGDMDEDSDFVQDDVRGANLFSDAGSFAEFAEAMGATELPDLLEAAAAYAAYVEGRPHFSRPQIMRQVANFNPEDAFSREAGLRSFGLLLRQGKIQKLKRGQFVIAKTTRFKPEVRYAGE